MTHVCVCVCTYQDLLMFIKSSFEQEFSSVSSITLHPCTETIKQHAGSVGSCVMLSQAPDTPSESRSTSEPLQIICIYYLKAFKGAGSHICSSSSSSYIVIEQYIGPNRILFTFCWSGNKLCPYSGIMVKRQLKCQK